MSLMTDRELDQLRSDILELLDDTCDVVRITHTTDDMGGIVEVEGTPYASLPCRIDPIPIRFDNSAVIIDSQQKLRSLYMFTTQPDVDLKVKDRVVVDGNTLFVLTAHDKHSDNATTRATLSSEGPT